MKLKEIALSIYYEPYVYGMDSNNYSSKEEYLNDSRNFFHEVLFPIKKQFIMETRNIASFFSRLHFENYKNNQYPFSKLIVSCCRDKCSIGRIINVDGIAEVRILYDYTGFRNKNAIQKKHDALQIIMNGLYVVANEFLLDTISFKNIESMIISCDYKNIWTWSSKWNKNRKYNASVYVDHDVDSVIIGMKIVDKSGTMIYNKKILTTKPDEWDYAPFLGKLFWQNNNEAVLLDKNDKVVGKWSAEQFSVYRQKPVEEIQIGDKVLSEDETTGEVAVKTVTETYINETDELIHIGVNGETISATPTHPFYVDKLGWTLARSLRAGDILVLSNGELVTVEWVQHEILESPIKVYNFEVQDFHTYFVGENGIFVHNGCGQEFEGLLPTEGDFGTYDELIKSGTVGDNITPNHMPSAEYMKKHGADPKKSPAFNMEQPKKGGRHRQTSTYGRKMTGTEKAAYYASSPRDALAHDLWDARKIYKEQGLYKEIRPKLREYSKYVQNEFSDLFSK